MYFIIYCFGRGVVGEYALPNALKSVPNHPLVIIFYPTKVCTKSFICLLVILIMDELGLGVMGVCALLSALNAVPVHFTLSRDMHESFLQTIHNSF